jgi:phage terminase large subunit-like protein
MMETCAKFKRHYGVEVNASTLVIPESFSRLKSVIKKPDDGYSPHCAVVDEYHQHDTDDQWSTFDTGCGARSQPLLLTVTTAAPQITASLKRR